MNVNSDKWDEYIRKWQFWNYIHHFSLQCYRLCVICIIFCGYDMIVWKYFIPQNSYFYVIDIEIPFLKDYIYFCAAYFFIFIGLIFISKMMLENITEEMIND